MDGNFTADLNLVNVAGGLGANASLFLDGCSNGAAGTIYHAQQSELLISN